jgi:RpiR family carbohydrate utilization transcriptional regulator
MPNRPVPAAETTALLRIQSVRKELADAEGRVADFICQNPRSVIRMAITELAARCETSEATVMRMCRKTGFRGFQDFKITLAQDLVSPVETIQQGLQEGDTPDIVVDKTFGSLIETLEHTRRLLQVESFEAVTKLLRDARQIDIYGSGNSAAVARDFHHKLRRLGLQATAYEDSHMQIISATALGPDDVAIGVSQSGNSQCVVDAIRIAKSQGTTTVALTSYGNSHLATECDYCLLSAPESDSFPVVGMRSRIAQLAIIAALHANLALGDMERFIPQLRSMEREIARTKL